jgi:hypothetical protein
MAGLPYLDVLACTRPDYGQPPAYEGRSIALRDWNSLLALALVTAIMVGAA